MKIDRSTKHLCNEEFPHSQPTQYIAHAHYAPTVMIVPKLSLAKKTRRIDLGNKKVKSFYWSF